MWSNSAPFLFQASNFRLVELFPSAVFVFTGKNLKRAGWEWLPSAALHRTKGPGQDMLGAGNGATA